MGQVEPQGKVGRGAVGPTSSEADVEHAKLPRDLSRPSEEDIGHDKKRGATVFSGQIRNEAGKVGLQGFGCLEELDPIVESRQGVGVFAFGREAEIGAPKGEGVEVDVGAWRK